MLIFKKLVSSKTIAVEWESCTFVEVLKLHLLDQWGIDINNQTLIFDGIIMRNYKIQEKYGIFKQTVIV